MFLTPVNEIPARNAKHRLQDLIEAFVKSDYDFGFVNFTDLDYKSAKVCCSCLHTAVKRSKAFVKVHMRGENVYLAKRNPDFLPKTFHIPGVTDEKSKIIAVDFDGILATENYPNIGKPIFMTINLLKMEQEEGARVILCTNRSDEPLRKAVAFCNEHGIRLDAVNENLPDVIEWFGCNPRKIFANEYWDDRSIVLRRIKHPDD